MMTVEIVPNTKGSPELMKKLEEEDMQPCHQMSTEECQMLLMETYKKNSSLDGLKNCPLELARKARRLLLEFNWYSEPFKERF